MGRSALSCCALPQEPFAYRSLPSCAIASTQPGPTGASKISPSDAAEFCAFARERFPGRWADAIAELGPEDASPVKRQAFVDHAARLGFSGDAGRVFDIADVDGLGVLPLAELRSQLACTVGAGGRKGPSPRRSPRRASSPGRAPSPGRGASPGRGPSPGRGSSPGRGPSPRKRGTTGAGAGKPNKAKRFSAFEPTTEDARGSRRVPRADSWGDSDGYVGGSADADVVSAQPARSSQAPPPPAAEPIAVGPSEELPQRSSPAQPPQAAVVVAAAAGDGGAGAEVGGGPPPPPPEEAPEPVRPEASPPEAAEAVAAPEQKSGEESERRTSLASIGSAWEGLLPRLGPTPGAKSAPLVVVAPMAGPEDKDGFPMVDMSDFVKLRPLPYVPVLPEAEDSNMQRSFVHHGRVVVVPLLPLHRLSNGQEEVKLPRGTSNWGMVKSKVMMAVNEGKNQTGMG